VEVDDLAVHFPVGRAGFWGTKRRVLEAVDGVSFSIARGEVLGLVGESGSGKSTTGRAILRRVHPTRGRIRFRGEDITEVSGEALRRLRRHMQTVFQDPYGSLNPRQSVLEIVAEPLLVHDVIERIEDARPEVAAFLDMVGLPPDAIDRYPHAFSGGQRQRIGIARALSLRPDLVVADEPVSALDVSIQAQIVNLMQELKGELDLTYLFIAHDLSVVRHISDRIAIMYAGRLVEVADKHAVYETPRHPYTKALLSAVPIPDPEIETHRRRIILEGEIPNPVDPPPGCRFASRCPFRQERCMEESPPLRETAPGHLVSCHFAEAIEAGELRPAREQTTWTSG
jgi:peptide/nickel transport system ATP-binding protein